MENQSLICNFCQEEYDLKEHIPRMLIECGHSICQQCLIEFYERGLPIKCELDNEIIKTENVDFESFVKNFSLIQILELNADQNNQSSQNSELSDSESEIENLNEQNLQKGNYKPSQDNDSDKFSYISNQSLSSDDSNLYVQPINDVIEKTKNSEKLSEKSNSDQKSTHLNLQPKNFNIENIDNFDNSIDSLDNIKGKEIHSNQQVINQDNLEDFSNNSSIGEGQDNNSNYMLKGEDTPQQVLQDQDMCYEHNKILEVICINCTQRICYKCGLFGKHQGHIVKSEEIFENEAADYLDQLTESYNKIQAKEHYIKNEFMQQNYVERSNKKFSDLKLKIIQGYDKLVRSLKSQKEIIIENIEKQFKNQERYLTQEIFQDMDQIDEIKGQEIKRILKNIISKFQQKDIDETALIQMMKEKDQQQIVYKSKDLLEDLSSKTITYEKGIINFIENTNVQIKKDYDLNIVQTQIASIKFNKQNHDDIDLFGSDSILSEDDVQVKQHFYKKYQ